MAENDLKALRVVFSLHHPHESEEHDVRNVTEWIDLLDKKAGLELLRKYQTNSTMMILECDKAT